MQLIDGTSFFTKMRKNLGAKSREISEADRSQIVKLYDGYADGEHSRIFGNDDFGYWTITVERPLRLRWEVTEAALAELFASKAWARWETPNAPAFLRLRWSTYSAEADLRAAITTVPDAPPPVFVDFEPLACVMAENQRYDDWLTVRGIDGTRYDVGRDPDGAGWIVTANDSWDDVVVRDDDSPGGALLKLNHELHSSPGKSPLRTTEQVGLRCVLCGRDYWCGTGRIDDLVMLPAEFDVSMAPIDASPIPPAVLKEFVKVCAVRDADAPVVVNRKGEPEPDVSLRDTENVPFGADGRNAQDATIAAYFECEVLPHVADAWIDHAKTKVGYEIPFTRHFYKYVPPRPLEEIDADLNKLVGEIIGLLQEIEK